jgi:hypothetical protein
MEAHAPKVSDRMRVAPLLRVTPQNTLALETKREKVKF